MAGHLLVLNAAEGLLQLLLARLEPEGQAPLPLCAQSWHAPSQGAELLAPALRDACARLKIQPGEITRIACVRGPGSFTGLRLVIATAAGLARATGALQAGLDYLPLLALSADLQTSPLPPERLFPRRYWVITHARRDLVHAQGFVREGTERGGPEFPKPLSEILVCSPEETAAIISRARQSAADAPVFLLGSGLTRNRAVFENAFSGHADGASGSSPLSLLPPVYDHPRSEALLRAAAGLLFSPEDISPLYVRHADAVDNLDRIACSLGLDPEQARRRFAQLAGPVE